MAAMELLVNVDVPDLERAIAFYRDGLGLTLARRLFGGSVAEMVGGSSRVYLLSKAAGSAAVAGNDVSRRGYERHWTPIHIELVADDVEQATRRAVAAGARLEGDIQTLVWGRLAVFGDPFGHGFCLIEFRGRGYDEVEEGRS